MIVIKTMRIRMVAYTSQIDWESCERT